MSPDDTERGGPAQDRPSTVRVRPKGHTDHVTVPSAPVSGH
jgi:hypothetical protein